MRLDQASPGGAGVEPASFKSTALRLNSREQLVHLLAEAAELEHNLLCCYLYAAFSLKQGAAAGLSQDDAWRVDGWRRSIVEVAMEEMTHLALIANLTVAVGARPHFNRPNLPVPPQYHPAGVVVELAAFNVDTLNHFIYLERPEGSEVADGDSFAAHARPYARGARPGASLMPSAVDYATIGEFYAHLRECFEALAADVGEAALFIGEASLQVGPAQVDMPGLSTVANLEQALQALDIIVTQGEGGGADNQDSHFARFVRMRDELVQLQAERSDFKPAWPVARNPLMRRPADPTTGVHIDEPDAAAVLDFGNALYALTLRLLGQAWAGVEAAACAKGATAALDAAMQLMGIMGAAGSYLSRLPASAAHANVHAGLTFTMPRATEPLLETVEANWVRERLDELMAGLQLLADKHPALQRLLPRLQAVAQDYASKTTDK